MPLRIWIFVTERRSPRVHYVKLSNSGLETASDQVPDPTTTPLEVHPIRRLWNFDSQESALLKSTSSLATPQLLLLIWLASMELLSSLATLQLWDSAPILVAHKGKFKPRQLRI